MSGAAGTSTLSFSAPDAMDVHRQLFGIMLCDQVNASESVPRSKESRKRKRGDVPARAAACFQGTVSRRDPVLRWALFSDPDTDAQIARHADAVCRYVLRSSPDMPGYVRDAYLTLQQTNDHIMQLALLFFFVFWHIKHCPATHTCSLTAASDPEAQALLDALEFRAHPDAMDCVHQACVRYEQGAGDTFTMTSFVHCMVTDRWKRIAPVPGAQSASSASAASASGTS